MTPIWSFNRSNGGAKYKRSYIIALVCMYSAWLNCCYAISSTRRGNIHAEPRVAFIAFSKKTTNSNAHRRKIILQDGPLLPSTAVVEPLNISAKIRMEEALRPGKIIYGYITKTEESDYVTLDIGYELPLQVHKSSLSFLPKDVVQRIANAFAHIAPEPPPKSVEDVQQDTIQSASKIPERKRKTYICPRYHRPYSYHLAQNEMCDKNVFHMLGIKDDFLDPNSPAYDPLKKHLHSNTAADPFEILVTSVDFHNNLLRGEFFSMDILRNKCIWYSNIFMDSVNPLRNIFPVDAIIREHLGKLLKVEIVSGKYRNLPGINAYTFAGQRDKIGDKIKVYYGSADPVLEHVYLFRDQIFNPSLRKEELLSLHSKLFEYYVQSGMWFKASKERVDDEYVTVRILGMGANKYIGCLTKAQLPIWYPDNLIDEAYKATKNPNEYFIKRNIEARFGKLDYSIHYDNCFYTRIDEMAYRGWLDEFCKIDRSLLKGISLTTEPLSSANDTMRSLFYKIKTHSFEVINKLDLSKSFPCMIVQQVNGYLYLAINYTRKPNFTLNDDYFVGMLKVDSHRKGFNFGEMVNCRIKNVEAVNLLDKYISHPDQIGTQILKSHLLPISLLNDNDATSNRQPVYLIWMDTNLKEGANCLQVKEFMGVQPIIGETDTASDFVDALTMENEQGSMAPETITQSFLKSMAIEKKHNAEGDANPYQFTYTEWDASRGMVAPPAFYLHNEELRGHYYTSNMDAAGVKMFGHILNRATFPVATMVSEYLCNQRGDNIVMFLDTLKDSMQRRKITFKDALFYYTKVKYLLDVYEDLFIEQYYESCPKQELAHATIIPKDLQKQTSFYQVNDINHMKNYIKRDYAMPVKARDIIIAMLDMLVKSENMILSKIRSRHRRIPDDVFLYSKKMLLCRSFKNVNMPEEEDLQPGRQDMDYMQGEAKLEKETFFDYFLTSPEKFLSHLYENGASRIACVYNKLLEVANDALLKRPPTLGIYFDTERIVDTITEEDLAEFEFDDTPAHHDKSVETSDAQTQQSEEKEQVDTTPKLQMTSKDWRRFNYFTKNAPVEDIKQFVRDMKEYRPVHGIKLPLF